MGWLLLAPAGAGSRVSLCSCAGFIALGPSPQTEGWQGLWRSWMMWPGWPDITQLVRGTAGLRGLVTTGPRALVSTPSGLLEILKVYL